MHAVPPVSSNPELQCQQYNWHRRILPHHDTASVNLRHQERIALNERVRAVGRLKTGKHENLSREIESLKHKITETSQVVVRLEVSLTRKVSDAEEALDQYLSLLSSLELFPPLPPPLEDVDLTINLHTASATPQGLLSGADIRKVVKPTLNRVVEMKMTARADVESERIKVDDELDQVNIEYETLDQEVAEVTHKTNALNTQAEELRDVR